jgi:hypothetical protein
MLLIKYKKKLLSLDCESKALMRPQCVKWAHIVPSRFLRNDIRLHFKEENKLVFAS